MQKEFIKLVSKFIHLKSVNWSDIKSESLNEIENINFEMNLRQLKEKRIHYSINLGEMDEKVKYIMMDYIINEEVLNIKENDIRVMEENGNLNEIVEMLLRNDNINIVIIGLLIILDSKTEYKCIIIIVVIISYFYLYSTFSTEIINYVEITL